MIPSEIISWPVAAIICVAVFILIMFLAPQQSLTIAEDMVEKSIDARGKTATVSALKTGKDSQTNYERISFELSGKDTEILSTRIDEAGKAFSYFSFNVETEDDQKLSYGDTGGPSGREPFGATKYKIPLRGGKTANVTTTYEVIT